MSDTPGWSAPDGSTPLPPSSYGAVPPPPYGVAPPPPAFGAYGYAQPAWTPKPGVIPLRPLGVGELLDGALTAVRSNWRVMIGVAAVISAFSGLLQIALTLVFGDTTTASFSNSNFDSGSSFSSSTTTFSAGSLVSPFVGALAQWIGVTLLGGIATVVVSRAVLGQRTSFRAAWDQVKPRFFRLLGLSFLVGLVIVLVAIVCVLPGIVTQSGFLIFLGVVAAFCLGVYLAIALLLSEAALVLERSSVTGAMRRSFVLVKGAWWRTFAISFLGYVIIALISGAITLPFYLVGLGMSGMFSGNADSGSLNSVLVFATIGSIIGNALTYPFVSSLISLLYIDRRMRSEGLDIELMRATGYGQSPA